MKKSINSSLVVIFIVTIICTGCNFDPGERGNGQLVTETKSVGDFQEVALKGNFTVILRKASEPAIIITTDENLMEYIAVENIGSQLEIKSERRIRPSDNSEIIIEYTDLDRINVMGAAAISSDGVFSGDFLHLQMSGAGSVDMKVDLGKLEVDISGAGAVDLSGNAGEQNISLSGAGGYDGGDLVSRNCSISISGVGGASVNVTGDLNASVSGVGGVSYRGNPQNVKSDVSGMGTVKADKDASS